MVRGFFWPVTQAPMASQGMVTKILYVILKIYPVWRTVSSRLPCVFNFERKCSMCTYKCNYCTKSLRRIDMKCHTYRRHTVTFNNIQLTFTNHNNIYWYTLKCIVYVLFLITFSAWMLTSIIILLGSNDKKVFVKDSTKLLLDLYELGFTCFWWQKRNFLGYAFKKFNATIGLVNF